MADAFGKLTESERKIISDALDARGFKNFRCVVCGGEEFALSEYLTSPVIVNQHNEVDATLFASDRNALRLRKAAHTADVFCGNCGYRYSFHLNFLGVQGRLQRMSPEPAEDDGDGD